jgi:hypothetical protein
MLCTLVWLLPFLITAPVSFENYKICTVDMKYYIVPKLANFYHIY